MGSSSVLDMRGLSCLVCVVALAFGAIVAQAAFSASYVELDAFFSAAYSDANLASHLIPSVSVAVVYRNGTIAYERAFGWQNKAANTPATSNTIYRLASVSKTFAGTVAMQLVQEGKASLDADLNTYFQRTFAWSIYPCFTISVFSFSALSVTDRVWIWIRGESAGEVRIPAGR